MKVKAKDGVDSGSEVGHQKSGMQVPIIILKVSGQSSQSSQSGQGGQSSHHHQPIAFPTLVLINSSTSQMRLKGIKPSQSEARWSWICLGGFKNTSNATSSLESVPSSKSSKIQHAQLSI